MAQPKYLQAIKNKMAPKQPFQKKEFVPAYPTWRPEIGKKYNVRFIQPSDNLTDEPFYEILFYRNLEENKRFVAPYQFDLPDPVKDRFDLIRKDDWNTAKNLKARESFFALLVDRTNEAAGVQVFEFSKDIRDAIYGCLQAEDFQDRDVFDVLEGHDFEVIVSPKTDNNGKPKLWQGKPVRNYTFSIRMKPTPLAPTEEKRNSLLESAPKMIEIQKGFVKSAENLGKVLDGFLERQDLAANGATPQSAERVGEIVIESEEEKEEKFSSAPQQETSPVSLSNASALAKLNALKAKAKKD